MAKKLTLTGDKRADVKTDKLCKKLYILTLYAFSTAPHLLCKKTCVLFSTQVFESFSVDSVSQ